MILTEGTEFNNAETGVVKSYLEKVEQSRLNIHPASLKVISDGNRLVLQVMNGKIKEYPIRRTFLYKLLNWYQFPISQINKLSSETITSVCNDYLMNIRRDYVTLKIEKGEALTLLSPDYNEISDLKVLRACTDMGIRAVSRNDFFLRITTEDKIATEPVKGDICGIGINITNSETGFRALKVSHYILRYVCSNGAIARISEDDDDDKRYHYGKEDLIAFLNEKVEQAKEDREKLIQKLKSLNDETISKPKEYYLRKMESVLGKKEAVNIMEEFSQNLTQYDLFNLITFKAHNYDLSKRYFLESLAGEIFLN